MRKVIILCALSGVAGGLAAIQWFGGKAVEPQSVAQDSGPYMAPGRRPPGPTSRSMLQYRLRPRTNSIPPICRA